MNLIPFSMIFVLLQRTSLTETERFQYSFGRLIG